MSAPLWASIAPAVAIGTVYALLAVVTALRSVRQEGTAFMATFVGGILVRMVLTLALTALVLFAFTPPQPVVFAATMAAFILAGMTAEVAFTLRQLRRAA
jgi:hypothetical protein